MNKNDTLTNDTLHQAFAENFAIYFSSHVAHVNTQGRTFVSDHKLFKGIYEDAQANIDTYAEFLRTRGEFMCDNLLEITQCSSITAGWMGPQSAYDYIEGLYDRIEAFVDTLADLYRAAEAAGDYGLSGYMQERLTTHKKQCWQLRAILNESEEEEEYEEESESDY
jgi:DNA-binding ferritin-like protein